MSMPVATLPAIERWNPFDASYRRDPHPTYARYRASDPVHYGLAPDGMSPGCWYVTRYEDVLTVLTTPSFGLEIYRLIPPEQMPQVPEDFAPFFQAIQQWFIFRDPPDHTRLRGLVRSAFTPATVAKLGPVVEETARGLLAAGLASGSMDIIDDFAFPLPVIVISKLLGFPEENRSDLKRWSHDLLAGIDLRESREETAECLRRSSRAAIEFSAYVREHVAARRRQPTDDLLTTLIAAEENSERLTEDELVATSILLLWAGHETTVNLIGNGLFALMNHRDQMQLLRDHPSRFPDAIEELLRYDSPAQMTFRFAFGEVTLGGKTIHTGDSVAAVIGAANRDPDVFADPDRLDISRQRNRHLSFGSGAHYCLGAYLARLEGSIALRVLLEQTKDVAFAQEAPEWNRSIGLRGLKHFPVNLAVAG
jgi:cytochrome P450